MIERAQGTVHLIEAEWRDLQRAWAALAPELDPDTRRQLETRLWQPLVQRMDITLRTTSNGLSRAGIALRETKPFELDTE